MQTITNFSWSSEIRLIWRALMARMKLVAIFLICIMVIASCSEKQPEYKSQKVTKLEVDKSDRELRIYNGQDVMQTFDIGLGFSPQGHKKREGDGKTPHGRYYIDRKNPYSSFHLSLGISYPNARDKRQAWKRGYSPGGDIMIHGLPSNGETPSRKDWTRGCIAVTNKEIEYLYQVVDVGTPIFIYE